LRYAFVAENTSFYPVIRLCDVMQVSRRGYYNWLNRPPSVRSIANEDLLAHIKRLFYRYRRIYGAPRIHKALRSEGVFCGLNRVARLMQEHRLLPRSIRKFRLTTDSRNSRNPAPNRLNRDFVATEPNQKWVADVTYIPTRQGWLYLATVLDLFSRKIVGWSMATRLESRLAQRALLNAIQARKPRAGLMVHTDQGAEYYAANYQSILKEHGFISSMSRKGDCYDNAVMESFFHSLKVEELHHQQFDTRDEAQTAVFEYIEMFYNRQRLHSSIGYVSPVEFEERSVA